jgi:hypothetical protein
MAPPPLFTPKDIPEIAATYRRAGTLAKAAALLGCSSRTLYKHIKSYEERTGERVRPE